MLTRDPLPELAGTQQKIDLLMEEYRVLYSLVTFRMTSLDRRIPIAEAALATFLGSVAVVPSASQVVFLAGLPLAQMWLVRTTINHARSFEDVLRRIDEIERRVNELAGEELLVFQSRHPSSGKATGGRTGVETVRAVYTMSLFLLGACVYLASLHIEAHRLYVGYAAYCGAIGTQLTFSVFCLRRYRYVRARSPGDRPRRSGILHLFQRVRTMPGRRRPRGVKSPDAPLPSTAPSAAGTAADR